MSQHDGLNVDKEISIEVERNGLRGGDNVKGGNCGLEFEKNSGKVHNSGIGFVVIAVIVPARLIEGKEPVAPARDVAGDVVHGLGSGHGCVVVLRKSCLIQRRVVWQGIVVVLPRWADHPSHARLHRGNDTRRRACVDVFEIGEARGEGAARLVVRWLLLLVSARRRSIRVQALTSTGAWWRCTSAAVRGDGGAG